MSSTSEPTGAIEVFYSYSHKDEQLRNKLETQLQLLERQGHITSWHDRKIAPGNEWASEIDVHLNTASIILLLVSPDYIASDYCYSIEMKRALERHEAGEACVIPVILRPVKWSETPFSKLYALPKQTKPVTTWKNRDAAFLDISNGIQKAIKELTTQPSISRPSHSTPQVNPQISTHTPIWNIPYIRNPFFTGREEILQQVYDTFKRNQTTSIPPQAISGLGGVGKTQTAIEYAYRYRDDYHVVLWARSELRDVLTSDFVAIATLLQLPEKDVKEQSVVVDAVKQWLEVNKGWLLILDNVEDLDMISEFIPSASKGHILLTTWLPAMSGRAHRVKLETMEQEEGALLLLRRANIIERDALLDNASDAERSKAEEISQVMDGLPLGLDQAGAYIEETECGLSSYSSLYQLQRGELLRRRGKGASSHPKPVAATWTLSFEKVQQTNPAAADLLRLCAFLYPDAIPEEIITEGAADLGPTLESIATDPMKLNDAIEALLRFSLVRRDPNTKTLTIHRLIQDTLKDGMDEELQREWVERIVRAVNRIFPGVEFATWPRCERYLAHAQVCAGLIEQWNIELNEAARLLNRAGHYLWERGKYREAELLLEHALAIREKVLDAEHLDLAQSLNDLGILYSIQVKYDLAESLFQRALAIREKVLEVNHPDVAHSLNSLGGLYLEQGKYDLAEALLGRALAIRENVLEANHPDQAQSLNNLAALYLGQKQYIQAKALFQRALPIFEKVQGPNHPAMATMLSNLGKIFHAQRNYRQAESFHQRALKIRENVLGPDHPDVAQSLNSLATVYADQGRFGRAEPLYQRAMAIFEKNPKLEHPSVANALDSYAMLLRQTKRKPEAAALEQRAKAIRDKHAQESRTDS